MRAKSAMEKQTHAFASRGNPHRGGECGGMRQAKSVSETVVHETGQLQGSSSLGTDIHESLGGYIRRNVSYGIQKALALVTAGVTVL